ncbi:MAG: hypothetical protein K0R60_962 [Microbacterium sp.]|nr:hypothetical protein [Microbacterium sp.]
MEETIVPVAEEFGLSLVPYYGLASGFLTGKYRSEDAGSASSPRAGGAAKYATAQGLRVIDTLEQVGAAHDASIAATALAWLRAQPTVAAPIASASRVSQVADLLTSARIELSAEELSALSAVSDWTPSS